MLLQLNNADECGGGSVGDTVKSCGKVIWAVLSVLVTSAKGVLVDVWVGGIVGAAVQPVQVKLHRARIAGIPHSSLASTSVQIGAGSSST